MGTPPCSHRTGQLFPALGGLELQFLEGSVTVFFLFSEGCSFFSPQGVKLKFAQAVTKFLVQKRGRVMGAQQPLALSSLRCMSPCPQDVQKWFSIDWTKGLFCSMGVRDPFWDRVFSSGYPLRGFRFSSETTGNLVGPWGGSPTRQAKKTSPTPNNNILLLIP